MAGRTTQRRGVRRATPTDPVALKGRSKPLELAEQAAFVQYLNAQGAPWNRYYAIPNGGKRTAGAAHRALAEGMRPGFPDLCIPVPAYRPLAPFVVAYDGEDLELWSYCGLYLEFKRQRGCGSTVKPEQRAWCMALREVGYAALVVYGYDEARAAFTAYRAGSLQLPTTLDLPPLVAGRIKP